MATPPVQATGSPFVTAVTGSGAKTAGGGLSVSVGDLIVVRAIDEDATAGNTGTPTNTGSATVSWTARGSILTGSFTEVHAWTGSVTGAGTLTVSVSDPSNNWGMVVNVFTSHGGVGAVPAAATGTGTAPTLTATWSANSWAGAACGDWAAGATTGKTYRTNIGTATENVATNVDGNYTAYQWEHRDSGSGGSQAVGMTAPTQTWSIVAVEVLGTAGAAAAIPKLTMPPFQGAF